MSRSIFPDHEQVRLPRPQAPAMTPAGFVACLVPLFPGQDAATMNWIYQQAFAKAQAVAQPSILERDLLGYWN